jgi:hypothetical protein
MLNAKDVMTHGSVQSTMVEQHIFVHYIRLRGISKKTIYQSPVFVKPILSTKEMYTVLKLQNSFIHFDFIYSETIPFSFLFFFFLFFQALF